MEWLFNAEIIVFHDQASDLRGLSFTEEDYSMIQHKIRDAGSRYSYRENGTPLALQLATYLMFGEVIQNRYHYAMQDAYFTSMLHLADRVNSTVAFSMSLSISQDSNSSKFSWIFLLKASASE